MYKFSSKIAHFQIRNFVRNGQISNKERGVPCRPCRVADSLFRPHPEQRARASREPQVPQVHKNRGKLPRGVCLCTTKSTKSTKSRADGGEIARCGLLHHHRRFGGCGAEPLHRLGSRTRQIGRVRTRPDGRLRPVSF